MLQLTVKGHGAHGFSHVVDAKDVCAQAQCLVMQDLRGRERFFRSNAELPEYHALARHAHQDTFSKFGEMVQFPEHLIVLFDSLGETESGVKNPVFHARGFCLRRELTEIVQYLGGDIVVFRKGLHGLGIAPHVHCHERKAKLGNGTEHFIRLVIHSFAGRNIIDNELADGVEGAADDGWPICVDGDGDFGEFLPDGFQCGFEPAAFLVFADGVGSGPGGACADVEYRGAVSDHLGCTSDNAAEVIVSRAVKAAAFRVI